MLLDHTAKEKALGKLTAADEKKRRQTGMLRKDGGARLSAGLVAIGSDCLAWAHRIRFYNERKAREKETAGPLE
jgi:hypothetical protein